jgi:hypothetical protein
MMGDRMHRGRIKHGLSPEGNAFVAQNCPSCVAGGDGQSAGIPGEAGTAGGQAPIHDGSPAWSPDGSRIVYVHVPQGMEPGPKVIYVMGADGSLPKRLTGG